MPKLIRKVPSYRLHKASGQALVTLSGKSIYLGPHNTIASREKYRQVVAQWLANHQQKPASSRTGALPDAKVLDINGLFVAYWDYCRNYYTRDGQLTGEADNIRASVRPLVQEFGSLLLSEVRASTLKAAREKMIEAGLARQTINGRVNRIRRMFKWGVENDMVEPSVLHAFQAVAPLRRGRGHVREGEGVGPVDESMIEAVMPHLPPVVQAMIRVHQYTGMRPGELVIMRTCDLDTNGEVWVYRPQSHKTDHLGHERVIYIGPRAQEYLRPYLQTDTQAWIFTPRQAMKERWAARPTHRRTPNVQRFSDRKLTKRYTPASYRRAIAYACELAFPAPPPLGRKTDRTGRLEDRDAWHARLTQKQREQLNRWQRDHRWHPHQLRHNAATHLRREFGVEAARVVLGHRSAAVTEIYAEMDKLKAADVMAKVG